MAVTFDRSPDELPSEEALRRRLGQLSVQDSFRCASIGFLAGGRRQFLYATGKAEVSDDMTGPREIPAGCLIRPVTATLVGELVAEGRLSWEDSVSKHIRVRSELQERLSGVRIAHLLNHTHGLDDPLVESALPQHDSFLESPELAESMAAGEAINPPGQLYSYSDFAEFLVRRVLENVSGTHYSKLLCAGLARWCEGRCDWVPPARMACGIEQPHIPVPAWLSFLEHHVSPSTGRQLAAMWEQVAPLPGWNPSEHGSALGWRSYGSGWFGHNAIFGTESSLLRLHPQRQLAIVIHAAPVTAVEVFGHLFGAAVPGFSRLPALLSSEEARLLELERYCGTYTRRSLSIVITPDEGSCLRFLSSEGAEGPTAPERLLIPARGHAFLAEPRLGTFFPFVQFVEPAASGQFRYLWNGKQLWRRSS